MARYTSAFVLIGGASLLVAWQVTPATSAPRPANITIETPLDQAAPILAEVNAQVDRLRERLTPPPDYPPPSRDPFNFARRAEPARPTAATTTAIEPSPVVVETPAPTLPKLVAILSDEKDGAFTRTAAFAVGDDVQVLATGAKIGAFVIRDIAADVVTLLDPLTDKSYQVR